MTASAGGSSRQLETRLARDDASRRSRRRGRARPAGRRRAEPDGAPRRLRPRRPGRRRSSGRPGLARSSVASAGRDRLPPGRASRFRPRRAADRGPVAGRALGARLPDEITVVGVAVRRVDVFDERLSPPVAAAVEPAVEAILTVAPATAVAVLADARAGDHPADPRGRARARRGGRRDADHDVHLEIGEESDVAPQALEHYWPEVSKDTPAEGARLVFSVASEPFACRVVAIDVPDPTRVGRAGLSERSPTGGCSGSAGTAWTGRTGA